MQIKHDKQNLGIFCYNIFLYYFHFKSSWWQYLPKFETISVFLFLTKISENNDIILRT